MVAITAASDPSGKSRRNPRLIHLKRLKVLAALSMFFCAFQYFDLFGIPGRVKNYLTSHLLLKDPLMDWVAPYEQQFPFSLQTSEGCRKAVQELLPGIAKADAQDAKAQADWHTTLKTCHGPLPETDRDAMQELSLPNFWTQLTNCGSAEGGCLPEWQKAIRGGGNTDLFVEAATCALETEFPFTPLTSNEDLPTLKQTKPFGWKPQRILLLSTTLGPEGPTMACKLVSTALTRGWNLTLIEGPLRGLEYKFSDALATLHGLLQQEPTVQPQDTLVMFVDSKDVLMQQTPQTILQKYLSQPYEFLLSAQENCDPMGDFPHNVGAKSYVCDHLFPYSDGWGIRSGPQYVNTGGWIATASAASVVLKELVTFLQRHNGNCLKWGKDQMLGSVAFLRHRNLIGLDVNYDIFSGGSWSLIDQELTLQTSTNSTKNLAFCHANYHLCPGLLHFNGQGSEGGTLQQAYDVLTSTKAIQKCPPSKAIGSLTVVKRTGATVKTTYKDMQLDAGGHGDWKTCLAGRACYGK